MSSHPHTSRRSRPLLYSPLRIVTHTLPLTPVGQSSITQQACTDPVPKPSKQRREYSTSIGAVRGEIRDMLNEFLALATGIPDVKMSYSVNSFYDLIFNQFGLVLRGWPPHIVFANLSSLELTTAHLRELHRLLKSDPPQIFFDKATPSEVRAGWNSPSKVCPGQLFTAPTTRFENRNFKKRQTKRYIRDGPKSAKEVDEELEAFSSRPLYTELSDDPIVD
ncbi:hypothetical protein C8Q80DRAFT_1275192 [Daedaleopsis nitida]|nr:hypothetical protein C8Q80DRAFT_1275192 [Daedaleopsis nitida]